MAGSAYAGVVTLDWSCGPLAEGLACYRRAEFFEAHEHWESVWLQLAEPEKSFLQALIQVTAAFHHLQTGNLVGTVTLLQRALQRLDLCPACFGGIAVAPLRDELSDWLRSLENGTPSLDSARPQIRPMQPPD
jgi:hypothetical protein